MVCSVPSSMCPLLCLFLLSRTLLNHLTNPLHSRPLKMSSNRTLQRPKLKHPECRLCLPLYTRHSNRLSACDTLLPNERAPRPSQCPRVGLNSLDSLSRPFRCPHGYRYWRELSTWGHQAPPPWTTETK